MHISFCSLKIISQNQIHPTSDNHLTGEVYYAGGDYTFVRLSQILFASAKFEQKVPRTEDRYLPDPGFYAKPKKDRTPPELPKYYNSRYIKNGLSGAVYRASPTPA